MNIKATITVSEKMGWDSNIYFMEKNLVIAPIIFRYYSKIRSDLGADFVRLRLLMLRMSHVALFEKINSRVSHRKGGGGSTRVKGLNFLDHGDSVLKESRIK